MSFHKNNAKNMFGCNCKGVYYTKREDTTLIGSKIELLESNNESFTHSPSNSASLSTSRTRPGETPAAPLHCIVLREN